VNNLMKQTSDPEQLEVKIEVNQWIEEVDS
jgi:hypothetical protein